MKIKTSILQEMVSKAIKGASSNKLIPITSLLAIELKDNKITLKTTDGSNHLYITQALDGNYEDFYSIVDADIFAKLVGKTTSEYINIEIQDKYLEVSGNGKYKLEIPINANGGIIEFPTFEIGEEHISQKISGLQLKELLSTLKVAAAKTMEVPCLTGYYIGDKLISTNREMICFIDNNVTTEPILISSEMAELLQLLNNEEVEMVKVDNKLLFATENIKIYGKELEGKDVYPVAPVENLSKTSYDNNIQVNKTELLNVLDRMALFVTDYDKNGVYLNFTKDGLEIQSQKSNATELVECNNSDIVEFQCLASIEMLKSQVQSVSTESVNIYYGQPTSIKIVDGNTIMILSLMQKNS